MKTEVELSNPCYL